jgi:hypothetical protein
MAIFNLQVREPSLVEQSNAVILGPEKSGQFAFIGAIFESSFERALEKIGVDPFLVIMHNSPDGLWGYFNFEGFTFRVQEVPEIQDQDMLTFAVNTAKVAKTKNKE